MPEMKPYKLDSLAFHEAVIHPAFADIVPDGFPFKGALNEFTLMDNVVSKRPIIDIRRHQNIMQRRDASCDLVYKKIFGATTRQVSTDEIYGATDFCRNSFYQGDLKHYRNQDPLFEKNILKYFQGALNVDLLSNSYFGDVDRVPVDGEAWSTSAFDGVFKWIETYITSGLIPAAQSKAIANGEDFYDGSGPATAYALLKDMYESQPVLMESWADTDKAFYVSKQIASAYEDYLIATAGAGSGYITELKTGIKQLAYKGIPILVQPTWTPIITQIKGSAGYAAVLTIRGNFIFATDKAYGEGPDGNTALQVFYDEYKLQWVYRFFLKAGTQIALPEFIVVAMSSFD